MDMPEPHDTLERLVGDTYFERMFLMMAKHYGWTPDEQVGVLVNFICHHDDKYLPDDIKRKIRTLDEVWSNCGGKAPCFDDEERPS